MKLSYKLLQSFPCIGSVGQSVRQSVRAEGFTFKEDDVAFKEKSVWDQGFLFLYTSIRLGGEICRSGFKRSVRQMGVRVMGLQAQKWGTRG